VELPKGRMACMLCIEGGVSVAVTESMKKSSIARNIQDYQMRKYDGCEIIGTGGTLDITATYTEATEHGELAHILIFTMASVPDAGRKDL
jgi:hypothetical protein